MTFFRRIKCTKNGNVVYLWCSSGGQLMSQSFSCPALGFLYLVPESLSVQSDYDHGRVCEEALVVKGQIPALPRHIQHVPIGHRKETGSLKDM